jgi:hypothetical protein
MNTSETINRKLLNDLLEKTLFNVPKLKQLKQLSREYGIPDEKISEYMKHILRYLGDIFEDQKERLPPFIYKIFIQTELDSFSSQKRESFAQKNHTSEDYNIQITELEESLHQRDSLLERLAKRINSIHTNIVKR